MREQLNSNPMVQIAVIGVLLLAGGIFLMTTMAGGGDEGAAEGGETSATVNGVSGSGATPGEAVGGAVADLEAGAAGATTATAMPALPPIELPARVVKAWRSGATVALLFVRGGGIDDRLVRSASLALGAVPGVVSFVVPASRIARFTAVTGGVGVERVPALVVLTPKGVGEEVPTASVRYGYQSPQSVVQAVVDAGYEGPTLEYHP